MAPSAETYKPLGIDDGGRRPLAQQGGSGLEMTSDPRAKEGVQNLSVDYEAPARSHGLGEDHNFRSMMSRVNEDMADPQERSPRDPVAFHRDTPAEQRVVIAGQKKLEAQRMMAEADAMIAGMHSSVAEGPSARRLAGGTPETNYDTELTGGAEDAYQRKFGDGGTGDYDLRGAHASHATDNQPYTLELGDEGEGGGISFPNHLPDTFKKPNHDTFSNESQYAPDAPERAGRWDRGQFVPPTPKLQETRPDSGPYYDPDGHHDVADSPLKQEPSSSF